MHGEEHDDDGLPLGEVVMEPAVAMGQDPLLSLRYAGFAPPPRRPQLAAVIDLLLPLAAVLSADSNSPLSASALSAQLKRFDFQTSLVDLALVSAGRCLLILCAYVVCDGCRGLYLGFTTLCSLLSIAYLLLKAVSMYMAASSPPWRPRLAADGKDMVAIEALFLSSFALAVAHVVVAYRGSWRERRKLLVFRIDVEAVRFNGEWHS
ncbi:hypothetical protein MUK42_01469 [Musa troglodytarum]|uniref:MENTAL domain-containing protein n=1 Tax=Musa troglodytarum TaxID=320322 RepID=A0A9E7ES21_9LILI|nr:hypothetical protein MUK42_01469 [Musa troglodytarum]